MRTGDGTSKKPMIQATLVFFVLLTLLTLFVMVHEFTDYELKLVVVGAIFIFSTLIAVIAYHSAKNDTKNDIKYDLGLDITPLSQELYSKLYENSPVPYLLIDQEGKVISSNVSGARMLGVPKEKLRGFNIFQRIESDEMGHIELLIEKFQHGISIGDETVRVTRPDGSASWALLSLYQFVSRAKENLGLLTLVDITKQKRIDEAKTNFVSLASHQLRTPIAAIKWSAELLRMEGANLTNRQKKYTDRLLIGTQRMALLVDDFLRVSRFELGTFQSEFSSVEVSKLVDDILLEQTPRIKQKELIVKKFYDLSLPPIVSDAHLLRMITSNLLSNAVKYSRPGGIIHIGFNRQGTDLVLSVADNGIGIPPTEQSQIFTKLYRATNAARTEPDGTGLGLYIVKEAAEVLDGRVTFTSTENVGSVFEVQLPVVEATQPTES